MLAAYVLPSHAWLQRRREAASQSGDEPVVRKILVALAILLAIFVVLALSGCILLLIIRGPLFV